MICRIPPRRPVWTPAGRRADLHLAVFIVRRHFCFLNRTRTTSGASASVYRILYDTLQAAKAQRPTRWDHLEQHVDQAQAKQDRRDGVSTGGEKGCELSQCTSGETPGRSLMAGGSCAGLTDWSRQRKTKGVWQDQWWGGDAGRVFVTG